jgi:hypothetical protein
MVKTKGNRTESAMRAYDTKSRNNAKLIGKRVADKPAIQEAIQTAFKNNGLDVDYLINKEKEIIESGVKYGKPSMSDARMSIQNMHKLLNSYPERVNKNMNLNIKQDITNKDTTEILSSLKALQETTKQLVDDINS